MTAPVILLDENSRPYNGKASIKLRLRKQSIQDLFNGKVESWDKERGSRGHSISKGIGREN